MPQLDETTELIEPGVVQLRIGIQLCRLGIPIASAAAMAFHGLQFGPGGSIWGALVGLIVGGVNINVVVDD